MRGLKRRSLQWGRKYLAKEINNKTSSSYNNSNGYSLTIVPKTKGEFDEDSFDGEKWANFEQQEEATTDFVRCSFNEDPFNDSSLIRPENSLEVTKEMKNSMLSKLIIKTETMGLKLK